MAYQHDIIGLLLILLAFDPVGDTAPYEDDNLIKIMVVIFKILFLVSVKWNSRKSLFKYPLFS